MNQTFRDEPGAHALYDEMLETMRRAQSLSCESDYRWESAGKNLGHCTYRLWMRKPNYARLEVSWGEQVMGILVLDGHDFRIHWPNGRPCYGFEDPAEYERTRLISYMREPAPPGRHSIAHQGGRLGGGMSMTILQPSVFHGCPDGMDAYLDGVAGMGTERVGDEECDLVEVSFMAHQRSRYLWLSRRDHLPRKLKQVVRVSDEIVMHETWSRVAPDEEIPLERFRWRPPEGWQEWRLPAIQDGLLKPGSEAPDFDLVGTDGRRHTLHGYRGKALWLAFWRVG